VQQTIYLATANSKWSEADKDDMFEIVTNTAPDAVLDTDAAGACKLESYEDTPTFDA
jgi:branched-chain amino acid transport system substrate-binding protein